MKNILLFFLLFLSAIAYAQPRPLVRVGKLLFNDLLIEGIDTSLDITITKHNSLPSSLSIKNYIESSVTHYDGDVIYINASSGNDTTAELGYSNKPFETIQAAIDSAQVWGVENMVVYPGNYVGSDTLDVININMFCFPGTTLDGYAIIGNGKSIKIRGLDVWTNGQIHSAASTSLAATNIYIEVDSMYITGFVAAAGFIDIEARSITNNSPIYTGNDTDQRSLKIKTTTWYQENEIIYMSASDSLGIDIQIDNLYRRAGYSLLSNWQNRNAENILNMKIGSIKESPVGNGYLLYYDVTSDSVINCYFKFDIGSYRGPSEFGFYIRQDRGVGSKMEINCGEYIYEGTKSALWDKTTGNKNYDTNMQITFSGKYVAKNAPIIEAVSKTLKNQWVLTGTFETKKAATPVFQLGLWPDDSNSGLTLYNAKLINDGTVAPITVTGATTIRVMNSFANSTVAFASITQAIESITQNASVR